jgi:thiol-disulfide isomerase/thioredoxin
MASGIGRAKALACAVALAGLASLGMSPVGAQTPASAAGVPVMTPAMEGKTFDGKSFKLSSLNGKVVLVMYWSTGCAVCRDKMPELRINYEGWAGKPFELVAVSTDTRMQDVQDYERIISRTVPVKQRFIQLWMGDSSYRDNLGKHAQLPAACRSTNRARSSNVMSAGFRPKPGTGLPTCCDGGRGVRSAPCGGKLKKSCKKAGADRTKL